MTNAKRKTSTPDQIAEYTIRTTPDSLVIARPPSRLMSLVVFGLFGPSFACFLCIGWLFALREGGIALLGATIFTALMVVIFVNMFLSGVNTKIVMITREAIYIKHQPYSFRTKQIPLPRVQRLVIETYSEADSMGYSYAIEFIPKINLKERLLPTQSPAEAQQLKALIERFLGLA